MTDVHDKKTRSYNASRIKGKDTKPELIVRRYLFRNGFRYRLNDNKIIGKPDIVLPKYKTIVDVRGCFWHGHKDCKYGDMVKTESMHYRDRIATAITRDKRNVQAWKKLGWKIIVVWGSCQLEERKKQSQKKEETLRNITRRILSTDGNTSD